MERALSQSHRVNNTAPDPARAPSCYLEDSLSPALVTLKSYLKTPRGWEWGSGAGYCSTEPFMAPFFLTVYAQGLPLNHELLCFPGLVSVPSSPALRFACCVPSPLVLLILEHASCASAQGLGISLGHSSKSWLNS